MKISKPGVMRTSPASQTHPRQSWGPTKDRTLPHKPTFRDDQGTFPPLAHMGKHMLIQGLYADMPTHIQTQGQHRDMHTGRRHERMCKFCVSHF
jgi:hypothetical protein